jgi:hypothetical protein
MNRAREKLRLILNIFALTTVVGAHLVFPGSFFTRSESHPLLSVLLLMNVLLSPDGFNAVIGRTEVRVILAIIAAFLAIKVAEIESGKFEWPVLPGRIQL